MPWNEAALLRWRHETPLGPGRLISSLSRWANFANICKSNAKSNARWQKVRSWLRPWQIWPAWDMSQGLRIATTTTVSPAPLKDGKWVVQIISNHPSSFHQAIIHSLLWWSCGTGPKSFVMVQVSQEILQKKKAFAGSQPTSRHVGSWPLVHHKWWVRLMVKDLIRTRT